MKKNKILSALIITIIFLISIFFATAKLSVLTDENQKYEIISMTATDVNSKITSTITPTTTAKITIKNNGEPGFVYIEAGIYERTAVRNWNYKALSLVQTSPNNCNDGEKYVQTYKIYMSAGETSTFVFEIPIPTNINLINSQNSEYSVGTAVFLGCWGEGKIYSTAYKDFKITLAKENVDPIKDTTLKETCYNIKKDGTETDFNCGGQCSDIGATCKIQGSCKIDKDCTSPLKCLDKQCSTGNKEEDTKNTGGYEYKPMNPIAYFFEWIKQQLRNLQQWWNE
jgi:hypothetical protein